MPKKTISIAQWAQIHTLYLPIYLAIEGGYLSCEGVAVDLKPVGNDDEVFKYVISGKAQFGLGDPTFCSMGSPSGKLKAQVVASLVERAGIWGITHSSVIHPVKTISDLVGLRIGCFPRPSTSYALITDLKNSNKRMLRSMTIVEAPIGQQAELLAQDKADIALYIEPFISLAESKGWRVVYSFADLHGPYSFSGLYAGKAIIDQDPDLVQVMVNGIGKALKTLHKNPDIGLDVLKKLMPGSEPAILKKSIRRCLAAKVWPQTPLINAEAWSHAVAVRQSGGDVFFKDIYAGVNNSFAENCR